MVIGQLWLAMVVVGVNWDDIGYGGVMRVSNGDGG